MEKCDEFSFTIRKPVDKDDVLTIEQNDFFRELKQGSSEITDIRVDMRMQLLRHCIQKGIAVIVKPFTSSQKELFTGTRALYKRGKV